ncbi:endonuclease domain-containing protein [Stenotrophomonas sp. AB1(2024)]|uniref:endonuclease domain-containing protein n=1 Tax=Stenotrophomonas sp. AB1(2024) TaxID=3132215 RepID=UPI0030AB3C20
MKKDGWRDWLSTRYAGEKSDSPIEALYTAAFDLVRDRLAVPRAPLVRMEQQAKLGPYRADVLFTCASADGSARRLVVELDGHEFHERTKEQAAKDRSRDRWMLAQGVTVIRFTGSEVWNDPFSCADQTADQIHQLVHGTTRKAAKAAACMAYMRALFED